MKLVYLLGGGDAQGAKFVLQVLQLRVELLFFFVEVKQDVMDVASITTDISRATSLLHHLLLAQAFLVPVRLRVERLVVSSVVSVYFIVLITS